VRREILHPGVLQGAGVGVDTEGENLGAQRPHRLPLGCHCGVETTEPVLDVPQPVPKSGELLRDVGGHAV
jgi:hypothetical protein